MLASLILSPILNFPVSQMGKNNYSFWSFLVSIFYDSKCDQSPQTSPTCDDKIRSYSSESSNYANSELDEWGVWSKLFLQKSCPDAHSENHPAPRWGERGEDAPHKSMQSWATPSHPIPPQALEKDFTLHSVKSFPQLKWTINQSSALDTWYGNRKSSFSVSWSSPGCPGLGSILLLAEFRLWDCGNPLAAPLASVITSLLSIRHSVSKGILHPFLQEVSLVPL